MKTGMVFEIIDGKATIMISGGRFLSISAKSHWQKGDIISFEMPSTKRNPFVAVAACFLLFFSLSLLGKTLYFRPVSLVSLDVNPSIELNLNVFHRVIATGAFNQEGINILNKSTINYKTLDSAIALLLANGMDAYITDTSYITFTVLSSNEKTEAALLTQLKETASTHILSHHQTASLEFLGVDENLVEDAHSHHVTAGKYMALMKLKEAQPEIVIDDYKEHSIEEIKGQINHPQPGHTTETNPPSDTLPDENNHNSKDHEYGNH